MKQLIIFTDGGARGNPGPAASGVVVTTTKGEVVQSVGKYWGKATNNQAEYRAVKLALELALKLKADQVTLKSDSQLVIRQLNGQYKVKNAELRPIFEDIKKLAQGLNIRYEHVYRAENKLADQQVNLAIDRALGLKK